jgi:hypothetical protein
MQRVGIRTDRRGHPEQVLALLAGLDRPKVYDTGE